MHAELYLGVPLRAQNATRKNQTLSKAPLMTLDEVLELLNANDMLCSPRCTQTHGGEFTYSFSTVNVSEGGVMSGATGFGPTPEAARADYARNIAGKRLMHSLGGQRRYLVLPRNVTPD